MAEIGTGLDPATRLSPKDVRLRPRLGLQPGAGRGVGEPSVVVEGDVLGQRSGQHSWHLADVGDLSGAQEQLRVVDPLAVPEDAAFAVDESAQAGEQA
jgi:hypothetical protein